LSVIFFFLLFLFHFFFSFFLFFSFVPVIPEMKGRREEACRYGKKKITSGGEENVSGYGDSVYKVIRFLAPFSVVVFLGLLFPVFFLGLLE
jgi:hypothetical protein